MKNRCDLNFPVVSYTATKDLMRRLADTLEFWIDESFLDSIKGVYHWLRNPLMNFCLEKSWYAQSPLTSASTMQSAANSFFRVPKKSTRKLMNSLEDLLGWIIFFLQRQWFYHPLRYSFTKWSLKPTLNQSEGKTTMFLFHVHMDPLGHPTNGRVCVESYLWTN